jgi:large subunit ribosomal protein L23
VAAVAYFRTVPTKISRTSEQEDGTSAGVCSILSQLAREGRLAVVDTFTLDAPKTKLLARKSRTWAYDNLLIITGQRRREPRVVVAQSAQRQRRCGAHADPMSLIRHANVLSPRMRWPNSRSCLNERRCDRHQEYRAPDAGAACPGHFRKGTFIGEKHNQYTFACASNATKPEIKAAVELMFSVKDKKIEVVSVQVLNVGGKEKRFGGALGRRKNWKKAYVRLKAGQEINFAAGKTNNGARKSQTDFAWPPCGRQGRQCRPAQGQPHHALVESQSSTRAATTMAVLPPPPGGGHKQHYRMIDFKRDKDASSPRSSVWSTIRTAAPISRWSAMPTASAAISSRRKVWPSAHAAKWRRRADQVRQCDAVAQNPGGHDVHCIE